MSSALDLDHPPPTKKFFDRRQSFKDIQGAISKMNPKVVKTVIESGKRPLTSSSVLQLGLRSPSLPLSMPATAPLTIFYDGMVSTFDVSPSEAETVMKFALGEGLTSQKLHTLDQGVRLFGYEEKLEFDDSCTDLPIARKKSLQRFLKKRKGRMSLVN
uniref:protein TIFY 9-like isoform X1 n=1 Tax=Erigeron canadensis TaxID=72917 RepID=UPI001CB9382A|nr:protein TIFY 9-like isoform X1 [Erigeron canadensis]